MQSKIYLFNSIINRIDTAVDIYRHHRSQKPWWTNFSQTDSSFLKQNCFEKSFGKVLTENARLNLTVEV